jgi:uncharacterized membrane protein YjgN (DUF898 family)
MKCSKCGFIQGPRTTCKSCGRPMSPVGPETGPGVSRLARSAPVRPAAPAAVAPSISGAQAAMPKPAAPEPAAPEPAAPEPAASETAGPDALSLQADTEETLDLDTSRRVPPLKVAPSIQGEGPPAAPAPASGGGRRCPMRPSFHGNGGTLLGIYFVNALLALITLGIYSFWGRVKVRRYLVNETAFEGDRLDYHATGKELLLGWFKAMLVFGIPFVFLDFLPRITGGGAAITVLAGLLQTALILALIPMVVVSARRYRMSRTSWRGIRFSFRGPVLDFAKLLFGGGFLTVITLGFYAPYFQTRRRDFLTAYTYFGTERFEFDGQGKDLLRPYIKAMLLFPFTLGLSWIWYEARKHRYFWDHTLVGEARFHSTVEGRDLLVLYILNMVLILFTLGIGFPWVVVRTARFYLERVTLTGPVDMSRIEQDAQAATATGEELAGFFDLDMGFGLG